MAEPAGEQPGLVPFDLPEGYREAAERFWDGRELDAGYMRRALGLAEPGNEAEHDPSDG